jgi:hypothetical protein
MGRKAVGRRAAGISDAAVRAATGHGWTHWFAVLDQVGMARRAHADIARFLRDSHGLTSWWSQSVTVAYEQAKGLRQPGEKRDGFAVSKSQTLSIPLADAYAAWADANRRITWLDDPDLEIRTARAPHGIRFTWKDGRSIVAVSCVPRGAARTQVSVQHERLPSATAAEHMRGYWSRQLDRLVAEIG